MKKIVIITALFFIAGLVSYGQTWTEQVSGSTTSLNTVSAVSDQVGWIGGNAGLVLKTTNGGTNWTSVGGSPIGTDAVYAICGIDANTCLVSTSPSATYVFKTTNGGTNWTQVFTMAGGFVDDIKMFSPTNGFMYGDPVGGRWELFKTTNAGSTWDSTGLYLPQAGSEAGWNNAMFVSGTGSIWFGTNNTKVYYSTNGGSSWLSGATTGSVNTYSVAFSGATGFTGQTIALTSTNGGANWSSVTVPGTGTIYGFCSVAGRFWYGRGSNIYFSSNGGANFASQYTSPSAATYQALSFVQTGSTIRGWAVTSTGKVSVYNETVTPPPGWVEQISGSTFSLNTVSAVSDQVGWVGGNTGLVLRTTNGGTNWTSVGGTPIGSNSVYAICGIDANTCLVSTSPSATYIYKTTNGGTNWTQVFTMAGGFVDDIKMFSATNGFMYGDPVGGRWELFKTTNAGTTWDSTGLYLPQAGSEAGWNNAMFISGTGNIWFGTNNTRVYYSTNGGTSWSFGASTGSVNTYSVAFNGATGFTGQTIALTSTNGGANWASVTVPGTGTIYSFSSIGPEFWYARGSNIYFSSNNGSSFASQYLSPSAATYQAMSFVLSGSIIRGWAVTATGKISMYNEQLIGIRRNQNEVPTAYSLSQNYPNPFNPTTNIRFEVPKSGNVRITVYDVLGREVGLLLNEFKTEGVYTYEFNASNLASGVYFYRLVAGDFTAVKKMILAK